MGIPKSRLSRRLSRLEARLGVRLMHRSTRRLLLTDAGELFLKHCHAMLAEAETGIAALSALQASPRGKVRESGPLKGIANGNLSVVLPERSLAPHLLYAVFLSRRGLMPTVRCFLDFINEKLKEGLSDAVKKEG